MTEVKTNYKNKYVDYNCVACEKNYTFVEATETEKEDNRYEDKIWVICKELDGIGELPKSVKVVTKCDAYECKSCYYQCDKNIFMIQSTGEVWNVANVISCSNTIMQCKLN